MADQNKREAGPPQRRRDRERGLPWVSILAAVLVLVAVGALAWWSVAVDGDVDNGTSEVGAGGLESDRAAGPPFLVPERG